jgi:hypothetical protein
MRRLTKSSSSPFGIPHAGPNTPMPDSSRRPGKICRVIMVNKTFLPTTPQTISASNSL